MNDDLTHLEKVLLDGLKADAGRKSCEYARVALYIVQAMMLRSMRAAEQSEAMPIGRATASPPLGPMTAAYRRYTITVISDCRGSVEASVLGIVPVLALRTWGESAIHALIDLRVNEEFDCLIDGAASRIVRIA